MAITVPPAITPAPSPPPQRGDRTTFSTRVDALMLWLTTAGAQFSALATNVYDNALIANTSAATAESTASVIKWVSGGTYSEGQVVWSPINFTAYRAKLTNSNTVDPSTDTTNWASLYSDIYVNKDISGGFAGLTLFKINFKNAANTFTSFFTNTNTAARTYTFPDKDGTVAMLSDVTNGLSTSTTLGIGYASGVGVGATVTQPTAYTDNVTINALCGTIITANDSLGSGLSAYATVVNNKITSVNDVIVLSPYCTNGGAAYANDFDIKVAQQAVGGFILAITNVRTVTKSGVLRINFTIIRNSTT